jgi:K+-sensing histidine kinase KdpD
LLSSSRLNPLWWVGIAGLLLWIEYVTELYAEFPVFYVIPVTFAAWYSGRWPALALAIAMPVVQFVFLVERSTQSGSLTGLVMTTTFRGVVIAVMALWCARLSEHERALHRHVQTLEGLLPICSFCKKIRNEAGVWERLESFISKRSDAQFSHGFCPACGATHYLDDADGDAHPTEARELPAATNRG